MMSTTAGGTKKALSRITGVPFTFTMPFLFHQVDDIQMALTSGTSGTSYVISLSS